MLLFCHLFKLPGWDPCIVALRLSSCAWLKLKLPLLSNRISIKIDTIAFVDLELLSAVLHTSLSIWMFPKIGVPQNEWFIMANPIKIDVLGVPLFLEAPIYVDVQYPRFLFTISESHDVTP